MGIGLRFKRQQHAPIALGVQLGPELADIGSDINHVIEALLTDSPGEPGPE